MWKELCNVIDYKVLSIRVHAKSKFAIKGRTKLRQNVKSQINNSRSL